MMNLLTKGAGLNQRATGSNRVNLTGQVIGGEGNRTSQAFTNIAPANNTLPISLPGTSFYFTYTSSPLAVRPRGGVFTTYTTGQGLEFIDKPFVSLEVFNPNAVPVLFQLFVGFDRYIDKRLIVDNTTMPLVCFPTYPVANAATRVDIVDLSNQAFTDINGGKWYAVSREAAYIFNPDTGTTLLLQKAGSIIANGPALGVIYPTTTLRWGSSGNASICLGGANINAIVHENYYALPRV